MDRNGPQGGIVVVSESLFIFGLLPGYLNLFLGLVPSARLIQALHMRREQQVNNSLDLKG